MEGRSEGREASPEELVKCLSVRDRVPTAYRHPQLASLSSPLAHVNRLESMHNLEIQAAKPTSAFK